jgi:hypothetical protein
VTSTSAVANYKAQRGRNIVTEPRIHETVSFNPLGIAEGRSPSRDCNSDSSARDQPPVTTNMGFSAQTVDRQVSPRTRA